MLKWLTRLSVQIAAVVLTVTAGILIYLDAQLPDVREIRDSKLQVPLRIYSADEKLIAEFGEKRRSPIKLQDVPPRFLNAMLATEDARFYNHSGVDIKSLMRAALSVATTGSKSQGGSTITMQVARNYFLTREKTYLRKVSEILLAWRLEKNFTKDEILELYLNKIYFGKRAYGIAAAAEVYYGKEVNELSLAEMATLAGLPQAPSHINPINNPQAALKRRNHVLERMLHYGFINEASYNEAIQAPIQATYHGRSNELDAPYIAEMVRQVLYEKYGDALYTEGFSIYTTVNSKWQNAANQALQRGILAYDERHGYRGPLGNLSLTDIPKSKLSEALEDFPQSSLLEKAVVLTVTPETVHFISQKGIQADLSWEQMRWAKRVNEKGVVLHVPNSALQVVSPGDVIFVRKTENNVWRLAQLPEVSGALVSLDPKTGGVRALIGGFDFVQSHFNRAFQAERQPGSNFKPFIYAAAIDNGFTPASTMLDAPIIIEGYGSQPEWRPQNDSRIFYGPTRLRVGLSQSRNLVSIRLLQALGVKKTIQFLDRFGFTKDKLPQNLSLALGTNTVTPLELARGYAVFANNGFLVQPYLIQEVRDANGQVTMRYATPQLCDTCPPPQPEFKKDEEELPEAFAKTAGIKPTVSPQVIYLMDSMLQETIQTGTAKAARILNRDDLAGKTGTTNEQMDGWFSGFNPEVVTTVWMGFDEPKSLKEYGSQTALPIWIDFMKVALKDIPETPIEKPPGILEVLIDPNSGYLAYPGQKNAIPEYFIVGNTPNHRSSHTQSESNASDDNEEEAGVATSDEAESPSLIDKLF